jgi:hypothetical protein
MKNRMRSLKGFVSMALAVSPFFAPACANDMSDKSGETHFLCSKDDDCTRHFGNDDYYCGTHKYCALKADGGTPQGDGGRPGSDGGGAGGASGGKAGGGSSGKGGDFAGCKTPPNSTCSEADTCAALGCPSLQFDEHGCLRLQCDKDDDCATDERCALNTCESSPNCTVHNGTCECASAAICGQVPRCNPTATTGPRGEWESLDVTVIQSPCAGPTFDRCTKTWHVTPDGHVTFTDGAQAGPDGGAPVDEMLDTAQMFDIVGAVKGPELRLAMRDGLPCATDTATDISLKFALKLSTQTMTSGEVGGCMGGDNVYARIYNIVSHASVATGNTGSVTKPDAGSLAQAALTFTSAPAPGQTCSTTNGLLSFPSMYTASVLTELNCDTSMGCQPDQYVVVEADQGTSVSCRVVASGDQYDVQLSLSLDGTAQNEPSGTFGVSGVVSKTGGVVLINESNSVAGGGGTQSDCTLTIEPAPHGFISPSEIWASFDCPAFRDPRNIGDTGCEVQGKFLFKNCLH